MRSFKENAEAYSGNILELLSPDLNVYFLNRGIYFLFAKQQVLGFYVFSKIHKIIEYFSLSSTYPEVTYIFACHNSEQSTLYLVS